MSIVKQVLTHLWTDLRKDFWKDLKRVSIKFGPYFLLGSLLGHFLSAFGLGILSSVLIGIPLVVVLDRVLSNFEVFNK